MDLAFSWCTEYMYLLYCTTLCCT